MSGRALFLAAAAVAIGTAAILNGAAGCLYLLLVVMSTAPGWPIGRALFGRAHLAGWVAGGLIGYAIAAVGVWGATAAGYPTRAGFGIAWMALLAATWLATRRFRVPMLPLEPWERRDAASFGAVLLVATVIAVVPLARVGAERPDGSRAYRAYFTADFVWHMALTAELSKFDHPPRNPYLADRSLHYYWTYFLVPAAIAARGPAPVRNVELCLKLNALVSAWLLVSSIFLLARAAVRRPLAAAAATALAIVAPSAEGLVAIWQLHLGGVPLRYLRDLNIDAISSWYYQGLRVDGLQRCFWYVPQHSMAYAAGAIALLIAAVGGAATPAAAIACAGLALAASVVHNPFVGGVFALAYGLAVAIDALIGRVGVRALAQHAIAIVPVAIAILFCVGTGMVEGAAGAVQFGFLGPARHATLFNLLLSLGPALVPAIAGAWPWPGLDVRRALPALVLLPLGLVLMHLVSLNVDEAWVGFRAGQILLVSMPVLIARLFAGVASLPRGRAIAAITAGAVLLIGAPTTAIDVYNAQDVTNEAPSAGGFAWTIRITPDERAAFRWIERATPASAIVQMEPVIRDRETWSLIPSFAERRMAAGQPISLLNVPEYAEKSAAVQALYATPDAARARAEAVRLGIDYLYVDRVERGAYPQGVDKFAAHPELFAPVFQNEEVRIYAIGTGKGPDGGF